MTPTLLALSVDGEFGASDSGATVTSDFDSLGLDEDETTLYPRVDFSWAGMHLSASSLQGSFSGEGTLDGTITIDGTTIAAGTDVDSDFEFGAYSGVFTWDIIPIGMAELGLGIGVTLVDLDIDFEDTAGTDSITTDESFPVPLLAARLGFDGAPVEVNASVGFIDVDVDEGDLSLLDLDVNGAVHLLGGRERLAADLVLGYRMFDVEAEYEDEDSAVMANFEISGPYIGVRISF
ncbi:MAG: hypothetical protein GY711_10580 [bacterium]|nr:hypothetical protein [bacterium]